MLLAGLPSRTQEIRQKSGRRLQRVRVGPFETASEANEAAARVRELGLEGVPAVAAD
ncbi:SPOR domain-containing protein [Melaminivora jejuensis]|nr:SPOR domain-containing protein [Melaminivora jejuensis]